MKRLFFLCAALGLWLAASEAGAQFIYLNVSYKAIVNPATHQPAPYATTNQVREAVRFGNLMLEKYQRGYRLRLTDFTWVGGSSHPRDPSIWHPFIFDASCNPREELFRADAYTNYPAMYAWNHSALNIYLTTFPCNWGGGFCATCSGRLSDYIVNGTGQGAIPGFTAEEVFGAHMMHESGHYFGLNHTHGGSQCYTNAAGHCLTPNAGDDGLASTIPDVANGNCSCMNTIDDLARLNYGVNYAQLSANAQYQCGLVWSNLMSYHDRFGYAVLTEEQLDLWTDTANLQRAHAVSGYTRYVSTTGNDGLGGFTSATPLRHVQAGVDVASSGGGDIVLLRPGNYNEKLTIKKPLTLRSTRAGWASIGKP